MNKIKLHLLLVLEIDTYNFPNNEMILKIGNLLIPTWSFVVQWMYCVRKPHCSLG